MINKALLSIFLMLVGNTLSAQKIWKVDTIANSEILRIETEVFTAVTIRFTKGVKPPFIKLNSQWNPLVIDEHIDDIFFDQSTLQIQSNTVVELMGQSGLRYQIIFQNVPELSEHNHALDRRSLCQAPSMVQPSTWRSGLAEPKPNPASTRTGHCIVHHSASGNGNTNYTSLVRNYYVQHTQVNGWDDIGYNFLIAIDGTIFIGRDKQNLRVPTYKVKGAHFCSKNDGTTGICLIGNFNDISPSDTMIGSLQKLLSWVVFEEKIVATDSSPHPNSTDLYLSNIAGHRNGCATECPGNNGYALLPEIRNVVEKQRKFCDNTVGTFKINPEKTIDYKLIGNKLEINPSLTFVIYDLSGRQVVNSKSLSFNQVFLEPGIYVLYCNNFKVEKIKVE